jgi:glycerol kinase
MCDELREYEPLLRERTGLVLDPYFSATKIRWLLDRFDAKNLAFGTVDTWLIWNLTGGRVHVTDETNASRTLLFNIHTRDWDDDLLRIFRVPREILPRVVASMGEVAETRDGIPIAGIAGDQQAALFGQRCTAAGMAKNTYGTGCFIVLNTGDRAVTSKNGLLTTIACSRNGGFEPAGAPASIPAQAGSSRTCRLEAGVPTQYALEGSVFVAGAAIQWLRDSLGIIRTASEIEPLAASVPDNGGVVFVPAFTGLGAPHWDPHARGAILGLTRGVTAAHIARAALEAIALQNAEVLDAMRADSGLELSELRVDGGASRNNLLMQIQADVAGVRIVRPSMIETTALGAARLAGLAGGWKAERTFEPQKNCEALREQWRDAIRRVRM